MATAKVFYSSAWLKTEIGSNPPTTQTRSLQTAYEWMPDKAKGVWVTLPNGTKFRKATSRLKFRRWIELGTPQYTESMHNSSNVTVTSSSGGYYPDVFMTAVGSPIQSSIGSLSKFSNTPGIPSEMRNEARTKALLEIADQKAGLGEDLATFRQTQRMIAGPAGSLLGGLQRMARDREMRKHLTKSYNDLLKHGVARKVADKYLEYVYGFKPLMSDIHGIIALMKEKGNKTLLLSGEGKSSQSCQALCSEVATGNTKTQVDEISEEVKVHCKIWGRIDPNCAGLRSLNSLGLLNPLSLAWELVPWSFVVDWFLPIGPVLQALTAPAGLIFVNGSESVRNSLSGQLKHHYSYYDARASVNAVAYSTIRYEGYRREVLNSWPLPGLFAATRPFRGDRSFKALALAITNLPRELRF